MEEMKESNIEYLIILDILYIILHMLCIITICSTAKYSVCVHAHVHMAVNSQIASTLLHRSLKQEKPYAD